MRDVVRKLKDRVDLTHLAGQKVCIAIQGKQTRLIMVPIYKA
jgi:hypothetical protein